MECQRCKSTRIASINAKCSDLCNARIGRQESDGYVPDDMGIGGGDYVEFTHCLACGQLQGKFPLPETELEAKKEEDDDESDNDEEE